MDIDTDDSLGENSSNDGTGMKKVPTYIRLISKNGLSHLYYSSVTQTSGMPSLRELFRIGHGPSSSHTMGPSNAAKMFKSLYDAEADNYTVILYGSLAATGKGHLTDVAIENELKPKKVTFIWRPNETLTFHVNGMTIKAMKGEKEIGQETYYSVGGGAIVTDSELEKIEGPYQKTFVQVYNYSTMNSIMRWCRKTGYKLSDFVYQSEGDSIRDYLQQVWDTMSKCVESGLQGRGVLQGGLNLPRKAHDMFRAAKRSNERNAYLFAYTLAVSENNAGGETVVTAPTCGACGIVPGVLYFLRHHTDDVTDEDVIDALAVAGVIGNITKVNASISGAEAGCQAEVGTACAMAAGAATFLMGGSTEQIEYAASMAIEHMLGLTCDPVKGLVQVPCIERNAMAAGRALECAQYALMTSTFHIISFDEVIMTMILTGEDIEDSLRETSKAGLAQTYNLDELARKQRINEIKSRLTGKNQEGSINLQWGDQKDDAPKLDTKIELAQSASSDIFE
ncbi:serine dehydratase [Blastocystis sp. ATCC 50177/Nand II]|uniref:Serine dehydratase n=1 Tax=Blastocystis sp. subtype 1 (strain ATCC 50177 / NandII) TaxID=478820 RepID=A0A196SDV5_BLAHN|nr:serine dehydratase [Blastocystis sp. ATCC 50177/Nand II]